MVPEKKQATETNSQSAVKIQDTNLSQGEATRAANASAYKTRNFSFSSLRVICAKCGTIKAGLQATCCNSEAQTRGKSHESRSHNPVETT